MKKIRVYTDHTGRWYNDYTEEELAEFRVDPLGQILQAAIQVEINKEILQKIQKG